MTTVETGPRLQTAGSSLQAPALSRSPQSEACGLGSLISSCWGIESLRPLQAEAIRADCDARDSLVVMPTGGGKSLCYQAPAVARRYNMIKPYGAMTLVVSPLVALMKDQVDSLKRLDLPAASLHSRQHPREQAEITDQAKTKELALLYVSPERLASPEFITLLTHCRVASVVVDEAHCVSLWGHDFRPDYARLGEYRKVLAGVPFHAFTATATSAVRGGIIEKLGLTDPVVLVGDFDRPNLFLSVVDRADLDRQLLDFIRARPGTAGIVYCITRRETERFARMLDDAGISAKHYHGGLDDGLRREVQDWFMDSALSPQPSAFGRVVVATIAFGMGIDKPDVRWIVHTAMPSSLEVYHQEIGRAGRDGDPAECVILYDHGDLDTWRERFESDASIGPDLFQTKMAQAEQMDFYCGYPGCRHAKLIGHFGQDNEDLENLCQKTYQACQADGACDVCVPDRNPQHVRTEATHGQARVR